MLPISNFIFIWFLISFFNGWLLETQSNRIPSNLINVSHVQHFASQQFARKAFLKHRQIQRFQWLLGQRPVCRLLPQGVKKSFFKISLLFLVLWQKRHTGAVKKVFSSHMTEKRRWGAMEKVFSTHFMIHATSHEVQCSAITHHGGRQAGFLQF